MTERSIFNFSAGPAVLPEPVIRKAQAALWDLDDSGIGLLEHSHRGKVFMKVYERAEARLRELAGLGDQHAVLFLQGGASSQFHMVPMNLLAEGETADYLDTGEFARKAIAEAKLFGTVHIAGSSARAGYSYIPYDELSFSARPSYIHYTSNNTIYGTEWATEPVTPAGVPVVCDASSDILSRPVDLTRYALVYAGAQKNLGPSGLTLVVIRKDMLERTPRVLPTMLRYKPHADNQSMYNTPPTFAIYVLAELLAWMKSEGGVAAFAERNQVKAKIIYDVIDDSALFKGHAREDSRSLMNITFRTGQDELDAKFCAEAERAGLAGLKGHRATGGMRASIYNAFPVEGCRALAAFMRTFEKENAAPR